MGVDYEQMKQIKAIEATNRERWLKVNPNLNDDSGIYMLTRFDEEGFKYAYIGQAKHILSRLCGHNRGYKSHVDKSLKKHGLISKNNPYGWNVAFINCSISEFDEKEKFYERQFADRGYQLRNKTGGGQGKGKKQIDEFRPRKGYHDGLKQGKKSLARELKYIIDTHLQVSLKPEKKNSKVSQKALEKFNTLLDEDSYK